MSKRLSWEEIQKTYPDQWVGLTEVERDGIDVVSAVVKYSDKTQGGLARLQITDNNLYSCYTYPDHLAPLGMVGYSG